MAFIDAYHCAFMTCCRSGRHSGSEGCVQASVGHTWSAKQSLLRQTVDLIFRRR